MNQSVSAAGSDKHELMKLLLTLNEGVRALGSRFDAYQAQVDKRFDKVTAEMTLLKNRVDMIEQHGRRMAALDQATAPPNMSSTAASATAQY